MEKRYNLHPLPNIALLQWSVIEDDMSEACSTHGTEENYVQDFGKEDWKKQNTGKI
jgi:hypothetical protein